MKCFFKHLVTVPNNRLATTIGHVHLNCVEKYLAIPITSVVDKGSEVGFSFANQTALRTTYAPDIDVVSYPPMLQNTTGRNFADIVRSGLHDGIYNPNHELHVNLFKWLWPRILQVQLDVFVEFWNNHRIRFQSKKSNVSGTTPRQAFTVPQLFGGKDCRIVVDQTTIDALRAEIPVSCEDAMRWVDDEFAFQAQVVYEAIGSPTLVPLSGWTIFAQLLHELD
ncbi:hypothetical protein B0H34DRAFT_808164 [Crassisporium funariophilum]|nr:hypothetical protein B0H34DRAFT_808164 [Crassisporium funariophilum]